MALPENDDAAKTIQRNYRGYKSRREMNGCGMSADSRWRELLKDGTNHSLSNIRLSSHRSSSLPHLDGGTFERRGRRRE